MTSTEEDNAVLRTRVKDLETAMMIGNKALATTFLLPPRLVDILGVLVSLAVVTTDMLQNRLDLASEPKVAMHRLRTAMKPFNITIHSRNRVGYWIDDKDKAEIKRLIDEKNPPAEAPAPIADAA